MDSRQGEQKNAYDQIYDLIFDIQKEKKNKPFPKKIEGLTEAGSSLVEIGTQPLIYPLDNAFRQINSAIEKATEVDLGGGIKGGFGSGAFLNPINYARKEFAKNQANAKWASVGGGLHQSIDSSLISLYARANGASAKTAHKIGNLFGDLIKTGMYEGYKHPTQRVFGGHYLEKGEIEEKSGVRKLENLPFRSEREVIKHSNAIFRKSINLRIEQILKRYPSLDGRGLVHSIDSLQNESSKKERFNKTISYLEQSVANIDERKKISSMIWGDIDNSEDFGLYRIDKEALYNKISIFKDKYNLNQKEVDEVVKYIQVDNKEYREKKIKSLLGKKSELGKKEINEITREFSGLTLNDNYKIAKDSIYWSLSNEITENLRSKGKYRDTSQVKNIVENILKSSSKKTMGMRVERIFLLGRWVGNNSSWGEIFLDGNWEKFGVADINFTQIVQEKFAKDEDGEILGSYYVGANSVMGKLLGDFYYLHPNNLIRGLLLDGSLWLKWAIGKDGIVNRRSFAYFMSKMSLGNSLSLLAKPLRGLSLNVVKVINPIFLGLKNFARDFFIKILGVTGLGGIIANLLTVFVGDRLNYIMNQIVIAIMICLISIFFIIFGLVGDAFYQSNITSYYEMEELVIGVVEEIQDYEEMFFEDEDFELEDESPE